MKPYHYYQTNSNRSTTQRVVLLFGLRRFERSNPTVRWTVGRRRPDDGETFVFISIGNENANESPQVQRTAKADLLMQIGFYDSLKGIDSLELRL
jgi:hypothetical protein